MAASVEKYIQSLLYFMHEIDNGTLGKTKLMKLMYFLDFDYYQVHHMSITGDTYIKKPFGPVPAGAETILELMESDGLIEHHYAPVIDFSRNVYTPLVAYDLSVFADSEVRALQDVRDRWRQAKTQEIVEASHAEEPWMSVDFNDEIPYETAYWRAKHQHGHCTRLPRPLTNEEREHILKSIISSQALEGVHISREEAEEALDQALSMPLPSIG